MAIKSNGCNEDGWDLFEEQTRQEFEHYACRRGYDLYKHPDYPWQYFNTRTEDAWEMYHHGHVKGRNWNDNPTIPN